MRFKMFFTPSCPKCPSIKQFLKEKGLEGDFVDAATEEGFAEVQKYDVMNAPTVIFFDDEGNEKKRINSIEELEDFIQP